jgi:hypothetical protein
MLACILIGSERAADRVGDPEQINRNDCAMCHHEPI